MTDCAVVYSQLVLDDVPKFTWGDLVIVSASAPSDMRPGQLGSVVGFTQRATETSYTVEFGDGRDAEVPEALLSGDISER